MFQVKCFESEDEEELEELINEFLETEPHLEVIDIKFSHSIAIAEVSIDEELIEELDPEDFEQDVNYSFSVLIIYQTKKQFGTRNKYR